MAKRRDASSSRRSARRSDSAASDETRPLETPAGGVIARLRSAGLLPKRSRGQHFLHDPILLEALVSAAELPADAEVFEVGTGPATLTRPLAARARRVLSVDVDARLIEFARGELAGVSNVELLHADVLGGPRGSLHPEVLSRLEARESFDWVSNLPYQIASPLILRFLAAGLRWRRATLLVQLEVAARLVAPAQLAPGGLERPRRARRDLGPLGLLVAYFADAHFLRRVRPGSFWPPPRVESALVRLDPVTANRDVSYDRFRRCVDSIFRRRRKQLGAILRSELGELAEERARAALPEVTLSARPEELSLEQHLRLASLFPAEPPESGDPG